MTGDVTINPNASCLVMTTEILRSMLYRGSGGCGFAAVCGRMRLSKRVMVQCATVRSAAIDAAVHAVTLTDAPQCRTPHEWLAVEKCSKCSSC